MKKIILVLTTLATSFAFAQVYNPTATIAVTTNPATGNVGIGKTTPTEKLEVGGSVRISDSGLLKLANSYFTPDQGGGIFLKGITTTSEPYLSFNRSTGSDFARFVYKSRVLHLEGSKLHMDNQGIEFTHSTEGLGSGAKMYGIDEGNGYTSMRFAVRLNRSSFTDAMKIRNDGRVGIGVLNFPVQEYANNYKLFVTGGILTDELRVFLSTNYSWADYVFAKDYDLKPLSEVEKFIDENGHLPNVPSATQVKEEGINVADMARIQQEKIEELMLYIIQQNKRIEALEAKLNK